MRRISARVVALGLVATSALLLGESVSYAADGELDTAIGSGFGKLVKYGRWTAALILAVIFCLAWAEKGQNSDNPHQVSQSAKKMLWSGVGFVMVIGYKLVLSGLVTWFNVDPSVIPPFLWQ
jgi:hypothetical protein